MNQIKDVEVSPTYEAPSYNENNNENDNNEEAIKIIMRIQILIN